MSIVTTEAKELLRNAVKIYRSKEILPAIKEEMLDGDLIHYIQENFIAKVVRQQDQMMIAAIKQAVDEGLVHTAIMIDRDYIQELFVRMAPRTVWFEAHRTGTCPCCGKEIYRGHNEKYCGFCGQAIAWELTP